ncbi:hypothetical protein, partial [Streptomyces sp. NPDC006307]|uniref:hypothetical protein n=1 Tax=Streptomyces sp. NPDC006307 TaxID=3156748 RepID=UPI0033A86057
MSATGGHPVTSRPINSRVAGIGKKAERLSNTPQPELPKGNSTRPRISPEGAYQKPLRIRRQANSIFDGKRSAYDWPDDPNAVAPGLMDPHKQ